MNPHERIDNPQCCQITSRHLTECVGQELNLQSLKRVGYSHVGSPMPSRRVLLPPRPQSRGNVHRWEDIPAVAGTVHLRWSGTGGSRTHKHGCLKPAALPVGVPCPAFAGLCLRQDAVFETRSCLRFTEGDPGWTRTTDRLLVRELPSPLGHRIWLGGRLEGGDCRSRCCESVIFVARLRPTVSNLKSPPEGRAGLEPARWCLTGTRSAAELPTQSRLKTCPN